jgi:hypothetical protein
MMIIMITRTIIMIMVTITMMMEIIMMIIVIKIYHPLRLVMLARLHTLEP